MRLAAVIASAPPSVKFIVASPPTGAPAVKTKLPVPILKPPLKVTLQDAAGIPPLNERGFAVIVRLASLAEFCALAEVKLTLP